MRDENSIPEEIRRFVLTSIPSVPYLEAVLLLRDGADRSWSAADVARRLYVSEALAELLLQDMSQADVAVMNKDEKGSCCYCYMPGSPELEELVYRLAETYARNLVGITSLIHSKLDRKAQFFADAFKWRKDK